MGLSVARRTEIPLGAPALTAGEALLGVNIRLIYSRETLRQLTVVIHGDWPLVELGAWYIAQVGDVESGQDALLAEIYSSKQKIKEASIFM